MGSTGGIPRSSANFLEFESEEMHYLAILDNYQPKDPQYSILAKWWGPGAVAPRSSVIYFKFEVWGDPPLAIVDN